MADGRHSRGRGRGAPEQWRRRRRGRAGSAGRGWGSVAGPSGAAGPSAPPPFLCPTLPAKAARPRRRHRAAPESALEMAILAGLLSGRSWQGAAPVTLNAFFILVTMCDLTAVIKDTDLSEAMLCRCQSFLEECSVECGTATRVTRASFFAIVFLLNTI